jgi:hypothetical protein
MKKILLAALVFAPISVSATPVRYDDNIVSFNPEIVCADLVGIPKNSDNFSYEDWRKFQTCVKYFRSINGIVEPY